MKKKLKDGRNAYSMFVEKLLVKRPVGRARMRKLYNIWKKYYGVTFS
jgi:hypothetical protein